MTLSRRIDPTAGKGRSRASEGVPSPHHAPKPEATSSDPRESAFDGSRGTKALGVEPDLEEAARAIALRQLTSSARSRAQLASAMAKKEIPEDVAERVLDRFAEVGLIDDAEYAAMLVRTRHAERGLARRALAQELSRKGIDSQTAAIALEQIAPEDEQAAALDLVRRRARATRGKPTDVRTRRLVAMLARKGHSPGSAFAIVAQVLAEEGAEVNEVDGEFD